MNAGVVIVFILFVVVVAFFVATVIYRQQRKLAEKKAQVASCTREANFHQKRFKTYQADIEKLRSDYNGKVKEIVILKAEMENKRKEVKEILGYLKEESKQSRDLLMGDFSRITAKRKGMLKNQWKIFDEKKTAYLIKLQEAGQDKIAQKVIESKKDAEFLKWTEINSRLERLKRQYKQLARTPLISFGKKNS